MHSTLRQLRHFTPLGSKIDLKFCRTLWLDLNTCFKPIQDYDWDKNRINVFSMGEKMAIFDVNCFSFFPSPVLLFHKFIVTSTSPFASVIDRILICSIHVVFVRPFTRYLDRKIFELLCGPQMDCFAFSFSYVMQILLFIFNLAFDRKVCCWRERCN